jgi:hypothetical protein
LISRHAISRSTASQTRPVMNGIARKTRIVSAFGRHEPSNAIGHRFGRRSAVASPSLTRSCTVSIPMPCVIRMDSVVPFGLPASIRNASRWSKGIAMPAP